MELSGQFPVKLLCEATGILRSSFYSWKKRLSAPSERERSFISNVQLFQEYHLILTPNQSKTISIRVQ